MNSSILYIYSQSSLGVDYKVNESINYLNKIGHKTQVINITKSKNIFCFVWKLRLIVTRREKIVFIRSYNSMNIFLIVYFIVAKIQGKKLALDIPTPTRSVIYECINNSQKISKWVYVFLAIINGPWVYWFFDVIIQYGDEASFFMFGNRGRTLFLGNGIDPDRFKIRDNRPIWPNEKLIILAVAHPNSYHGFDRIIKAIKVWNDKGNYDYKIKFNIVGNSPYVSVLKELTINLGLENDVFFYSNQGKESIYKFYSESHLAVSSLGLFRIKLSMSSVLKSREYCLVGIPFIAAGNDPDFDGSEKFRFQIRNDESFDEIINIFRTLPDYITDIQDHEIRNYAIKYLSIDLRLQKVMKRILEE